MHGHRQARRPGPGDRSRAGPRRPPRFEWLGTVPDTDAYLLLSLLQVMFAEGLADDDRVDPGRPTARSGCGR